jgi:hypothetical protein
MTGLPEQNPRKRRLAGRVYATMLALGLFVTIWLAALLEAAKASGPATVAFWDRVAQCETGGRWDWGSKTRPGEGHSYEGGVGFASSTWTAWATDLHLAWLWPRAYMAPRLVQIAVAQMGYEVHRGWWGCFATTGTPPNE